MVRISNTYIGRRVGGDVGDDIVVDLAVIRIQTHIDLYVGIDFLEVLYSLFINSGLGLVGIILGPEGNLELPGSIKGFGHLEFRHTGGTMAAGQQTAGQCQQQDKDRQEPAQEPRAYFFILHPLIPPLETPAMIFLRKIRKRTISGIEIATTAAIMAGMFSRPKPFSRISWIPLDTRK